MKPEEPTPPLDITDEKWIAAWQACCGIDHEEPAEPPTTVDTSTESP